MSKVAGREQFCLYVAVFFTPIILRFQEVYEYLYSFEQQVHSEVTLLKTTSQ
jgi:hypothetical protein